MPPYNFPIEQLTHTSTLKCAGGQQETPTQNTPVPEKTPHPMGRLAHWPPEMLRIVNRNPNIRLLLLEALEKEDKEKNRGHQP